MTPSDTFFAPSAKPDTRMSGHACVVANAADIEVLRASADLAKLGGATLQALAPGEDLADGLLQGATVLVLEVDPGNPGSLDRIAAVRARHPGLTIIAAIRGADVTLVRTLVRQGIGDIAQLPFDAGELQGLLQTAATEAARSGKTARLAPMVTIAGSTGGCGTTTVITHLAAALAGLDGMERKVCVVDLDLQGGEVAYYVGQEPRITVSALLEAGDRLDAELLRSAITDSQHGFSIIASPTTITPLDRINDEHLLKLLNLVRREFDFVLIDLPTDWTSWGLSIAAASSRLMLIVELSVASLRQAKRRLQLFDSVGIETGRVAVVANRVERKFFRSIGVKEIPEVLERDVVATLGDERDDMNSAQNEGKLIGDLRSHSRFSRDIENLARTLIAQEVAVS